MPLTGSVDKKLPMLTRTYSTGPACRHGDLASFHGPCETSEDLDRFPAYGAPTVAVGGVGPGGGHTLNSLDLLTRTV